MGFSEAHDTFAPGLLRAYRPFSATLCVGGASSQSAQKCEFENGFIFLPRCEEVPLPLSEDELITFKTYWQTQSWPNMEAWANAVCRWAKLQLPNGQKAHSVWYESRVNTKLRRASCIEVSILDGS